MCTFRHDDPGFAALHSLNRRATPAAYVAATIAQVRATGDGALWQDGA